MSADTPAAHQLRQLLADLTRGAEPWTILNPDFELPRHGDQSDAATRRRVRLLRAIVERAEREGLG